MYIPFEKGYIRFAKESDAEQLALWWADGKIMEHAGFPQGLKTDIKALKKRLSTDNRFKIWILEDINHQPIGELNHKLKEVEATIGIKICNANSQNKGIGFLALKAHIHYLFETLNIQRITLDTMIENTRAQHVYKKLGFKQTRIIENAFKDQTGTLRTAVEFELKKTN